MPEGTAEVVHLPAPDSKDERKLGVSVVANCGDRQVTFMTDMPRDWSLDRINETTDKMFAALDRQKAKYDLVEKEKSFRIAGNVLRQAIAGAAIAEGNFIKAQAERGVKIAEYERSMTEWQEKTRSDDQETRRKARSEIAQHKALIASTRQQIEQNDRDKDRHRQELMTSIRKFQGELKDWREQINPLREMIGQPPLTDYAEEEAFEPEARTANEA
ncbi:MAG TPA: hypothetical protein VEU47_19075 [Candidatus Cybelea sp.]|nr:hypothetical protein [Candidatus Cybelea sp.]